jgi:hypothetical protein
MLQSATSAISSTGKVAPWRIVRARPATDRPKAAIWESNRERSDAHMCKSLFEPARQIIGRFAQIKARLLSYSSPLFGQISIEVLVAISAPIAVEVLPLTGLSRLVLLLILALVFADLASRVTPIVWGKWVAALAAMVATIVVGQNRVTEQFYVDTVIRDYKTQRDLAQKYAAHDETLRTVVAQYDRLRNAQSIFGAIRGKLDDGQDDEINRQNVEGIKNVLNDIESVATPYGAGIRIKLGRNLYRVIYPVPMRVTPNVTFTRLPVSVTYTLNESTNLGFTVISFPLSITVDRFGLTATAES